MTAPVTQHTGTRAGHIARFRMDRPTPWGNEHLINGRVATPDDIEVRDRAWAREAELAAQLVQVAGREQP